MWLAHTLLVGGGIVGVALQLIMFILAYSSRISAEEEMMRKDIKEYRDYEREVRFRFVPFLV